MDNTSTSPLKAWMKKHSPIKSRNKPLPAAPRDDADSPTKSRAPMRTISANVSPSKDKGTKRKISGFIRGKPNTNEDGPLVPATKHRRISSVPGKPHGTDGHSGPYQQEFNESDKLLADRVQLLEAELKAARAELASTSTSGQTKPPIPSNGRSRPSHGRRAHSFDVQTNLNEDASARHARLMHGHRYDGLVESLLERDYESANATAASFASRTEAATKRYDVPESGRHSALASYGNMESMYMNDEEDDTEQLKRKRSELRAAEWKRIQESYGPSPQPSPSSGTKRSREVLKSANDERPARRQKQSHALGQNKPLPDIKQHSRRSASESHATSDLEAKRSSGIRQVPISSQPYKIEYVRARPKTPEKSKAVKVSKTPPKGRPTYDLLKAFGSNTPNEKLTRNENVEVFNEDGDQPEEPAADPKSASPHRRNIPSPSRLQTVREEFEWDDEVF